MSYLLDTNVAWRRVHEANPQHAAIKSAINSLVLAGERVAVTGQNLIEFRSLATRPLAANGLGLSPDRAVLYTREIEALFPLLRDVPDIYPQWKTLVDRYAVCGRQVHDARLVAVMLVYGVTHLLTLNPVDFRRYAEIAVVEP